MHVPPLNISEPCVSRGQGELELAVAAVPLFFNVPVRPLPVRSVWLPAVVRAHANRAPVVPVSALWQVNQVRVPAVSVEFLTVAANAALVLSCRIRTTARTLAV